MTRPHGLLRAGYPYLNTLGMRRVTNFPADIAFSGKGEAYILMRSAGVAAIRIWPLEDMEFLADELKGIGSYGNDDGQFVWPVQIVTDRDGHIFVSDEAIHRITRFDQEGEFVSKWGVEGYSDGEFNGPTGIAFASGVPFPPDRQGRLYVGTVGFTYVKGTADNGKEIWEFDIAPDGSLVAPPTSFVKYVGQGFANVVGVAYAADGLYFTEFFADAPFADPNPDASGARIWRVVPDPLAQPR